MLIYYRFAEKQAKLIRIKANRKHVLDRCEKLVAPKLKKETLQREAKRLRDRLDLLRLAITQRRNHIEEKRKKIIELRNHNNELTVKLPKYQKRVLSVGKMTHVHHMELENKVSTYREQADSLAALRRSRIRQLTKYIFPVYMTYDIRLVRYSVFLKKRRKKYLVPLNEQFLYMYEYII